MDNVLGSQWIVPLDGKREEMGAGMHMNRWDLWYQKKIPLKSGVHTRLPEDGVDQTSVLVVS
jgi:hypothetical protein